MSGKKWPRVWIKHHIDELGRHAPTVSSWEGDDFPFCGDKYLSMTEYNHILSEEHRLNVMGQERELALMARVKELEKKLLEAKTEAYNEAAEQFRECGETSLYLTWWLKRLCMGSMSRRNGSRNQKRFPMGLALDRLKMTTFRLMLS